MFIKKGHLVRKRVRSLSMKDLITSLKMFFFFLYINNQETKWLCVVKLEIFTGKGGGILK